MRVCLCAGWIAVSWRYTWVLHCFWTNTYEIYRKHSNRKNPTHTQPRRPLIPTVALQVRRDVDSDLLDLGAFDSRWG